MRKLFGKLWNPRAVYWSLIALGLFNEFYLWLR